jgi:hydroxyacylglutathione hydrolase
MVPVGIALTHGHVDHLAALGKLRDSYAARGYKLPIAINPADRRFLGTGGRETHRENLEFLGLDELGFFGVDGDELPKADVRLKEGDKVFNMDLTVLETPGHTPGSVCFYAEKEGILFSGDTLFFDGVGRSDLPGGSDKKLRESIQKKIATLPPETRVFPGHGPFTTVEREKRGNVFFRGMAEAPAIPRPVHIIPRPIGPAKTVAAPKRPDGVRASPAVAQRPSGGKPQLAVKRPAAVKRAPVGKRTPAGKRVSSSAKRHAADSKRHVTAKKSSPVRSKTSSPARSGSGTRPVARRPSGSPAKGQKKQAKRPVILKKGRSPLKKKAAQATRFTKAPGGGRKPAR